MAVRKQTEKQVPAPSMAVRVVAAEKNAAAREADNIRFGTMLKQLMEQKETKSGFLRQQ